MAKSKPVEDRQLEVGDRVRMWSNCGTVIDIWNRALPTTQTQYAEVLWDGDSRPAIERVGQLKRFE